MGPVTKTNDLDDKEVTFDDEEMVEVNVPIALSDDEKLVVGKNHTRNSEWVNIAMRRANIVLSMDDDVGATPSSKVKPKTDSQNSNRNFGLGILKHLKADSHASLSSLPGSTFIYSEVFKLDFSSASVHSALVPSILRKIFGYARHASSLVLAKSSYSSSLTVTYSSSCSNEYLIISNFLILHTGSRYLLKPCTIQSSGNGASFQYVNATSDGSYHVSLASCDIRCTESSSLFESHGMLATLTSYVKKSSSILLIR
nr:retrovirus-related Pol polyprotein from transposon TNT 1-94 [Tanacetum cinerariifolium]